MANQKYENGKDDDCVIETIPVLVIGATLTGLGIAYANKEETLVVERTSGPGQEFIRSFHSGEQLEKPTSSVIATELRAELEQRNLLSTDHRLHLGALAPVLFNRIKQDDLRVLFLTEIISVEEDQPGEYVVTLYNASGLKKIKSRSIIDTSSTCYSTPGFHPEILSKKLNSMLHNTSLLAIPPVVEDEKVEVVLGRFEGEVVMKYHLEITDDWASARSKLHQYWANRPESFGDWTLAIVADTFEIHTRIGPHFLGHQRVWLPSCAYSNVLEAFDSGYSYGKEGINNEAVSVNQ